MYPKARTLHGRPKGGYSEPLEVICDDENLYILKFGHEDQRYAATRLIFNEMMAKSIGDSVRLPIPFATIVEVDPEFIELHAELIAPTDKTNPPRLPGYHFGSRVIDGVEKIVWEAGDDENAYRIYIEQIVAGLVNKDDLPGTLAFDSLLLVRDRGYAPNNLVQNIELLGEGQAGKYRYHMIDHGNAFTGPAWTAAHLDAKQNDVFVSDGLPHFHKPTLRSGCFQPWMERFEQLVNDELIEDANSRLPESIRANVEDLQQVKVFIHSRKARLLAQLLATFPEAN